eukprot:5391437-Heterocapsa_arctica.AAC.1
MLGGLTHLQELSLNLRGCKGLTGTAGLEPELPEAAEKVRHLPPLYCYHEREGDGRGDLWHGAAPAPLCGLL